MFLKSFHFLNYLKMSRYLLCAYLIWEVMTLLECDVSVPFTFCSIPWFLLKAFLVRDAAFWIGITVAHTYSTVFQAL